MQKYNKMMCSFCGKSQLETTKLIASPSGACFICDECIEICREILKEEDIVKIDSSVSLQLPEKIKEELDKHIIDQEEAKRVLSVAVYNHYKRINYMSEIKQKTNRKDMIEIDKSNVLMIGPTGCGKTLLVKTLANILKVPFASADATTLTEAGYVGEDVESVLFKLIKSADYDIKKAEKGIIYIDEIDKIAKKTENKALPRDPSGEGVQQGLLKLIEGTKASVQPQGSRKMPYQENLQIDTSNILFICGGAFVGMDKIIEERTKKQPLGFVQNKNNQKAKNEDIIKKLKPQDLVKFGLIPEFIGRLPIVVGFNKLSQDALMQILVKPKNAIIKQYQKLFNMDGVDLKFTEGAIKAVANKAMDLKSGARGLRTILENSMLDLMYKIPSQKDVSEVVIDEKVINLLASAEIVRQKSTTKTANL